MADHFWQATFAVETHRVSVDRLAIERGENEGMLPRDLIKALYREHQTGECSGMAKR